MSLTIFIFKLDETETYPYVTNSLRFELDEIETYIHMSLTVSDLSLMRLKQIHLLLTVLQLH